MTEKKTRDQLMNFVPSYRAGYLSSGGPNRDKSDEEVLLAMELADVQDELRAEERGRKDGFNEREAAKKR